MTESTPEPHPTGSDVPASEGAAPLPPLAREQFVLQLGDLKKPLDAGTSYTIGKESSCDIRLGHGTISPIHCRLEITDEQVIVHDLNSLHGTKIDGVTVADGPWAQGQILEVGDIRIELTTRTVVATPLAITAPTGLVSHKTDESFADIMFTELKRAPWFAISIVAHALILMIVWFFAEQPVPLGAEPRVFSMETPEEVADVIDEQIEEEKLVTEEATEDEDFMETEVEETEEELFVDDAEFHESDTRIGSVDDLFTKVSGSGLGDILKAGKNALSGKFKKTVAGLRKNGLEIVFVFDSTGSMGTVLQAAKDRMEKMVSVMLELVPYARIGVITYRDSGTSEAYLTKQVELSRDFYRALNFLQLIYAGGGGDEPEAVYDALRMATTQKWSPTARRLVILIGDAPPHKHEEGKISSLVKSFARNGRSFVHAIITQPSGGGGIANTTTRTFKRIARDGRGEAIAFEDEGKILKAVMNLAFGRKESRSIDEVYRIAESRKTRASGRSQRILKEKNLQKLTKEFAKPVVPHDLIKAILKEPSAAVLNKLVDFLSSRSFNNPGKHAAAYILQRVLHVDSLIDPEKSAPISRRRAKGLRSYIGRNFN